MAHVDATVSATEALPSRVARAALWGFARVFSIVLVLVVWEALARSG